MLMPLVILFGWPVALGLGIGALVGNLAGENLVGLPVLFDSCRHDLRQYH